MDQLLDRLVDLQDALDALYRLRAAMIEAGDESVRLEALDLALTRDEVYQQAHWAFRAALEGLDPTVLQDTHHEAVARALIVGWQVGASTIEVVQREAS